MPNISRTRSASVSSAVGAWKSGQTSRTGWSQARTPSSTKVASSREVIDFVVEATRKCVSSVTGSPLSWSRMP